MNNACAITITAREVLSCNVAGNATSVTRAARDPLPAAMASPSFWAPVLDLRRVKHEPAPTDPAPAESKSKNQKTISEGGGTSEAGGGNLVISFGAIPPGFWSLVQLVAGQYP